MNTKDIVIVGGGLAGAVVAEEYRKAGGTGSVTIISQDTDLPVHRPPLSKEYLRGEEQREKVFVHGPDFYRDNNIEVRLQTRAEAIDLHQKTVLLDGRESLGFGKLVLATGARPRRFPVTGGDLPGVHYLRSLRSSESLREAYSTAKRAVIIGAGFIGMEVAATLTQRGVQCTVVEMAPRVWPRLVPEATAGFIQRYFEDRGVQFRFGRSVRAIEGTESVEAVLLEGGERLPADLVVAGVGALLNTELAERAGLPVDQGVRVDRFLRTEHPDVHAVGDIANFPDPVAGHTHLEHWDNALKQGQALGKTLAGTETPFEHVAYFFSDLFDLSINMLGYPTNWDETAIEGDPASGKFTTVYIKDGAIRAALMINDDARFGDWETAISSRATAASMQSSGSLAIA